MRTIEQIFSTNPDLLKEPEVKELIEQIRYQFGKIRLEKIEYKQKVEKLILDSKYFVVDGEEPNEVIQKILNL